MNEKDIKIKFNTKLKRFRETVNLTLDEVLRLNRFIGFFCKDLKDYQKRYILKDLWFFLANSDRYVGVSFLIFDNISKEVREIHCYPLTSQNLRIDLDALKKHPSKDVYYCKAK